MPKKSEISTVDTPRPDITRLIIEALLQEYSPAAGIADATDFKTTVDIIEEIESFAATDRETVTNAMISAGFRIKTIDGSPYWLLKEV